MSRSKTPSDFAYLDTGSEPKLRMIQKQIIWANQRFPIGTLDGHCIGLPGAGLQAERHRDEYRAYGIPDERQVMIDYDRTVHETQKRYMNKLDYKGSIILGDLYSVARDMWDEGKKIDIIDYDDVGHLKPVHEYTIADAAKHGVKIFILVITNRCNNLTDYHLYWKNRFGLVKRNCGPSKGDREPVGEIQRMAIRAIGSVYGYDMIATPYPGRAKGPPMLSCMLFKR